METIKKILQWLQPFPLWMRCLLLALMSAVIVLLSLSAVSACGTPKTVATVHNVNPNSSVTVTMSVSNSTSSSVTTDATPSVDFQNPLTHATDSY